MENRENRVRLNCMLMPDVKNYLDEQARAYGMSVGAYLTMVIQQYRQQTSVIENIPAMLKALAAQKEVK